MAKVITVKWDYEIGEGLWAKVFYSDGRVITTGRFFHASDAVKYLRTLAAHNKKVAAA